MQEVSNSSGFANSMERPFIEDRGSRIIIDHLRIGFCQIRFVNQIERLDCPRESPFLQPSGKVGFKLFAANGLRSPSCPSPATTGSRLKPYSESELYVNSGARYWSFESSTTLAAHPIQNPADNSSSATQLLNLVVRIFVPPNSTSLGRWGMNYWLSNREATSRAAVVINLLVITPKN